MRFGYTAVEQFSPLMGESWIRYIEWSKLEQLQEVISLDYALCPRAKTLDRFDYDNVLPISTFYCVFYRLDYVLDKIITLDNLNILAVLEEPESDINYFADKQYEFCGYDLVDDDIGISALVNCGGFEEAFSNDELNRYGLLNDFGRAKQIQETLAIKYPDEPHAYCTLWGIWRIERPELG